MRLFCLALMMTLMAGALTADESIRLSDLVGKWQGAGEIVLPGVELSLELTGEAVVTYDTAGDFYKTTVTAEKFLFVYSDSGHLFRDRSDRGIVWELWNNFGQHLRLSGVIEGRTMRGAQRFGEKTYQLQLTQETQDSLSAVITESRPDSTSRTAGKFGLWRVKSLND